MRVPAIPLLGENVWSIAGSLYTFRKRLVLQVRTKPQTQAILALPLKLASKNHSGCGTHTVRCVARDSLITSTVADELANDEIQPSDGLGLTVF
jgi:hypothetical protein